MLITKKRIISTDFLNKYLNTDFKIGIHITNEEYKKLGLEKFDEGLVIEPSPNLGVNCKRNAFGDSYPDKTKPKEFRVINTIHWSLPDWGGHIHEGYVDITREVYQRVKLPAYNIEFLLTTNENNESFIIAKLDEKNNIDIIKQTINMFLEIFGFCQIFDKNLCITKRVKIKRCNWELLPPGTKADISRIIGNNQQTVQKNKHDFNQYRLDILNSYNLPVVYEGTNGFLGYYAYVFAKICVLENAYYGNATYIVPKEKWQKLSKMSKQEILITKEIIEKINHSEKWESKIRSIIKKYENK